MNIVFIHGRSQQRRNPETLQAAWELALRRGFDNAGLTWPQGLTFSFPFYGDTLDDLVQQLDAPLPTEAVARGGGQDDGQEMQFAADLLQEMAQSAGVPEERILEEYRKDHPGAQERGPLNWGWVLAILRALEGSAAGDLSINAFTRDVYVYLTYPAVRDRIDQIVTNALPSDPCLVIAHSLGSVVGYNVLQQRATNGTIDYITVGSPLGIKTISSRLRPLKWPRSVRSWFNARDPHDVVALRPLDETYFPIEPTIESKDTVNNLTAEHHGIDGYLGDIDVVRRIHALCSA